MKPIEPIILDRPEPVHVPWNVIVLCALLAFGIWLWVFAVLAAF